MSDSIIDVPINDTDYDYEEFLREKFIADEELDLDYVPNKAREKVVNAALSNSLGFGGHNACLILKKYVK